MLEWQVIVSSMGADLLTPKRDPACCHRYPERHTAQVLGLLQRGLCSFPKGGETAWLLEPKVREFSDPPDLRQSFLIQARPNKGNKYYKENTKDFSDPSI